MHEKVTFGICWNESVVVMIPFFSVLMLYLKKSAEKDAGRFMHKRQIDYKEFFILLLFFSLH